MVVITMGVAGCGKTTVGRLLAEVTGGRFFDGDKFHSSESVAKMRQGSPLTDEDRRQWLQVLRKLIEQNLEKDGLTVISCSALKESYRQILQQNEPRVKFVYLKGSFSLIEKRMQKRRGHYFSPQLLQSQFDILEEPKSALEVSIDSPPTTIVADIQKRLGLSKA